MMGSKRGEMIAQWLEDVSKEKQVGIKLFQKESKKYYRMAMNVQQAGQRRYKYRNGVSPKSSMGRVQ